MVGLGRIDPIGCQDCGQEITDTEPGADEMTATQIPRNVDRVNFGIAEAQLAAARNA